MFTRGSKIRRLLSQCASQVLLLLAALGGLLLTSFCASDGLTKRTLLRRSAQQDNGTTAASNPATKQEAGSKILSQNPDSGRGASSDAPSSRAGLKTRPYGSLGIGSEDLKTPPEIVGRDPGQDNATNSAEAKQLEAEVNGLMRDMVLGWPREGFRVTGYTGYPFLEEPDLIRMTFLRIYEGEEVTGFVIGIENLSSGPIQVDPKKFTLRGLAAAAIQSQILAPKELNADDESLKRYPNWTRGFLVVRREEAGW